MDAPPDPRKAVRISQFDGECACCGKIGRLLAAGALGARKQASSRSAPQPKRATVASSEAAHTMLLMAL
jgi:hypothetical protein